MNNNNILHIIDANRNLLNKMLDIEIPSNGDVIIFRKRRLHRYLQTIAAFFSMLLSLFLIWMGCSLNYLGLVVVCPFITLYSIYVIREQSREIILDMANKALCVKGRWQKGYSFPWCDYQGHETYYSVKDFPEEFYIKFMDAGKIRRIKLADINPLFQKSTESKYAVIMMMWECVENNLHHDDYAH